MCGWGYPITLLGMFTKVDPVTLKQTRVLNVCPPCVKAEMQKVYDANPKMYRLPAVAQKALADAERWKRNHPEHGPVQGTEPHHGG
jgi:hypothetical protein